MTYDDEQEPQQVQIVYPAYELRWEDFLGIGFHVAAEVTAAFARGFAATGNDLFAAARLQRGRSREIAQREHLNHEFNGIINQPVLPEEPS